MARGRDKKNQGALRPKAPLGSLRPLIPFAAVYPGRVLPISLLRVIDHGFSPDGQGVIDTYFAALIGVVAVLALSSGARYYTVVTLGERVVADLRSAVFQRLTVLDPAFFDKAQSGEIVSRLTADATEDTT